MKLKSRLIAILVAVSWFIQFGIIDTISYAQMLQSSDESGTTAMNTALGQSGDNPLLDPSLGQSGVPFGSPVQEQASDVTSKVTVNNIQIFYRGGAPIGEDDIISKDEKIVIRYDFAVAEDVHSGDTAEFRLPSQIKIEAAQGSGAIPVPLTDSNGNETGDIIAYVELLNDPQHLFITFTDDIDGLEEIEKAFFEFSGEIDGDAVGGGGRQPIVFEVPGNTITLYLNFEEAKVEIDKELVNQYQEDGLFHQVWRIVANPEALQLYDLLITDTLPIGLVLVDYQFSGEALNTSPLGWVVNTDPGEITLYHQGLMEQRVEVLITTKATELSLFYDGQDNHFLIDNEVEAQANDSDGDPLDPDHALASAKLETDWIQKDGVVSKDNAYIIQWKIMLNTEALSLKNVELVDLIPQGLQLDEDSIVIKSMDGSKTLIAGTQVPFSSVPVGEDQRYTFQFGDIDDCYVVTYDTLVSEVILENDSKQYSNSAYFTWSLDGKGEYETPAVSDAVKTTNSVLKKNGMRYYPKRQLLMWYITVNESKNPITDKVTIVDELLVSNQQQTYISNTIEVRIEERGKTAQQVYTGFDFTDNGDGTLEIVFEPGMLNEQTAYISFSVSVDDLQFLAHNDAKDHYYFNKATLYQGDSTEGLSDTGSQFINTKVLEKSLQSYDRDTHTFTWELTVNSNLLSGLGEVTVTDTLPAMTSFAGVEVYEGIHVEVGTEDAIKRGDPLSTGVYHYQQDDQLGTVTFFFEDGALDNLAVIILLQNTIDEEFFEKNREETFTNRADITMSNVGNDIKPAVATGKASSSVVEKSGSFDADEEIIFWEVLVNANGQEWELSGASLTDTLQENLVLDLDTVQLYQYQVDPDTGVLSDEKEIPLDLNTSVRYDAASNEFVFVFPQVEPGNAYKLVFGTDVLVSGEYSNTITFRGMTSVEEDSRDTVVVDLNDSSAGAVANRKTRITLDKTAAHDADLYLEGAVFQLRDANGTILETATTDKDGHIDFAYWLRYGNTYYLYELSAPLGYAGLDQPLLIQPEKDNPDSLRYRAANTAISGGVEIIKTDPDGKPLSGVEFTLYGESGETVSLDGVTNPARTGSDGRVLFEPLPYGSYTLVETAVPEGVLIDGTTIPVTIETLGQRHTIEVINQVEEKEPDESSEESKPDESSEASRPDESSEESRDESSEESSKEESESSKEESSTGSSSSSGGSKGGGGSGSGGRDRPDPTSPGISIGTEESDSQPPEESSAGGSVNPDNPNTGGAYPLWASALCVGATTGTLCLMRRRGR